MNELNQKIINYNPDVIAVAEAEVTSAGYASAVFIIPGYDLAPCRSLVPHSISRLIVYIKKIFELCSYRASREFGRSDDLDTAGTR